MTTPGDGNGDDNGQPARRRRPECNGRQASRHGVTTIPPTALANQPDDGSGGKQRHHALARLNMRGTAQIADARTHASWAGSRGKTVKIAGPTAASPRWLHLVQGPDRHRQAGWVYSATGCASSTRSRAVSLGRHRPTVRDSRAPTITRSAACLRHALERRRAQVVRIGAALAAACAGDPDLRRSVRADLAASSVRRPKAIEARCRSSSNFEKRRNTRTSKWPSSRRASGATVMATPMYAPLETVTIRARVVRTSDRRARSPFALANTATPPPGP